MLVKNIFSKVKKYHQKKNISEVNFYYKKILNVLKCTFIISNSHNKNTSKKYSYFVFIQQIFTFAKQLLNLNT
jgi:hypothetical protein